MTVSDWSNLRKLMWLRGTTGGGGSPLTVTGATPLLMPGAVAKPMKSAKFSIECVQEGSGDPSPQNVRAITGWTTANCHVTGKNLLNIKADEMEAIGWDRYFPFSIGAGTYTISCNGAFGTGTMTGCKVILCDASKAVVLRCRDDYNFGYNNANTSITFSVTAEEAKNTAYISFAFRSAGATFDAISGAELMLTPGSTVSPYAPYSGTSVNVTFPAMGKNLVNIPDNAEAAYYVAYTSGDALATINALPRGVNLYCGYKLNGTAASNCLIRVTYADNSTADITHNGGILPEGEITVVRLYTFSPVGNSYNLTDVWVSKTQNDTYTPYTSTVYSGTIDPVTGEGVVTHALETDAGTLDWSMSYDGYMGNDYSRVYGRLTPGGTSGTRIMNYLSQINAGTEANGFWEENNSTIQVRLANSLTGIVKGTDTVSTGTQKFKAYFAEHPLQIVYPLATPIPFTVTPQTLTPPAGDAYIWADCGSTAEVTYIGKA